MWTVFVKTVWVFMWTVFLKTVWVFIWTVFVWKVCVCVKGVCLCERCVFVCTVCVCVRTLCVFVGMICGVCVNGVCLCERCTCLWEWFVMFVWNVCVYLCERCVFVCTVCVCVRTLCVFVGMICGVCVNDVYGVCLCVRCVFVCERCTCLWELFMVFVWNVCVYFCEVCVCVNGVCVNGRCVCVIGVCVCVNGLCERFVWTVYEVIWARCNPMCYLNILCYGYKSIIICSSWSLSYMKYMYLKICLFLLCVDDNCLCISQYNFFCLSHSGILASRSWLSRLQMYFMCLYQFVCESNRINLWWPHSKH